MVLAMLSPTLRWETDVMFIPHSNRDWLMPLFTVQKLGKVYLDSKNERVASLQGDICALCEYTQSAVQKNIIVQINCMKENASGL